VKRVEWRAIPEAMAEIAKEVEQRQAAERHDDQPAIYVFIYGLQRYRMLRKSEESFGGFSMDADAEKKAAPPDKLLADILREGPALGVHVISWVDTAASIDRTFDRGAMREFDNRILFQMSAADSSNLIDSPAANKLGFHRALAYSEELGTMEKFRPYALPGKEWLERLRSHLGQR
jgi:DNA segregation ATPase FtsK/SpoIIIE, S-DNA-T family